MSTLNDEVLRRVGRKLLLFRPIEGLFIFLLANAQVRGPWRHMDTVEYATLEWVA